MWRRRTKSSPLPPDVGSPPDDAGITSLRGVPRLLAERLLPDDVAQQRFARSERQFPASGVRDLAFIEGHDAADPDTLFDRLRWGGQAALIAAQPGELAAALARFDGRPEWVVEHAPHVVEPWRRGGVHRFTRLWQKPRQAAVLRKVLLDPPHRLTARHSYDVRLVPDDANPEGPWVVLKRVPTLEQAMDRLVQTCPTMAADRVRVVAEKLVHRVFPLFLTREAAFLKLLQRDLPEAMRPRTPRLLALKTGDDGLVRSIRMTWLRMGGQPISQLEFARQTATLLHALHEHAGVMHLDLRLDNHVLTEHGVGFVDLGTAIRRGERLDGNPVIKTLSRETLEASEINARLRRQVKKGLVTSSVFHRCHAPATPAFDLFAWATNITRPHDNPDLIGLVGYDPDGDEAIALSRLRRAIVRPTPGAEPRYRGIHDVCVEFGLAEPRRRRAPSTPPQPVIVPRPAAPRPAPSAPPAQPPRPTVR